MGGKLQSRVRRCLWHRANKGKQFVDGKYVDWVASPVSIDLSATKPAWWSIVEADDPDLLKEIIAYKKISPKGEVSKFLAKKPKDYNGLFNWYIAGNEMGKRLDADVQRLKRHVKVAEADLIEAGWLCGYDDNGDGDDDGGEEDPAGAVP